MAHKWKNQYIILSFIVCISLRKIYESRIKIRGDSWRLSKIRQTGVFPSSSFFDLIGQGVIARAWAHIYDGKKGGSKKSVSKVIVNKLLWLWSLESPAVYTISLSTGHNAEMKWSEYFTTAILHPPHHWNHLKHQTGTSYPRQLLSVVIRSCIFCSLHSKMN